MLTSAPIAPNFSLLTTDFILSEYQRSLVKIHLLALDQWVTIENGGIHVYSLVRDRCISHFLRSSKRSESLVAWTRHVSSISDPKGRRPTWDEGYCQRPLRTRDHRGCRYWILELVSVSLAAAWWICASVVVSFKRILMDCNRHQVQDPRWRTDSRTWREAEGWLVSEASLFDDAIARWPDDSPIFENLPRKGSLDARHSCLGGPREAWKHGEGLTSVRGCHLDWPTLSRW